MIGQCHRRKDHWLCIYPGGLADLGNDDRGGRSEVQTRAKKVGRLSFRTPSSHELLGRVIRCGNLAKEGFELKSIRTSTVSGTVNHQLSLSCQRAEPLSIEYIYPASKLSWVTGLAQHDPRTLTCSYNNLVSGFSLLITSDTVQHLTSGESWFFGQKEGNVEGNIRRNR